MENNHAHVPLTSSELAALWSSYMNDTLGCCTITYFLKDVEDPDIRNLLSFYLESAKKNIEIVTGIFQKERLPIPVGFTKEDVNMEAKRLFSDTFMLYYIQSLGVMGINSFSIGLPTSSRLDIRKFYTECLVSSAELFNRASNLLQQKGLYIRPPHIPYPDEGEFIHKQHFLAGWLGEKRPFTTQEISFLFYNLYRNTFHNALLLGFAQVAKCKDVREYMERGVEITKHHCTVFSNILIENNLLSPMTWNILPLASTDTPFSDKMMMFHISMMNAAGIAYYGTSVSVAFRKDLTAAYARLTLELAEFSEDGAKIMINNGWLEKPFSAPDRKKLVHA